MTTTETILFAFSVIALTIVAVQSFIVSRQIDIASVEKIIARLKEGATTTPTAVDDAFVETLADLFARYLESRIDDGATSIIAEEPEPAPLTDAEKTGKAVRETLHRFVSNLK